MPVVVCRKCKNSACLIEVMEDHADVTLDLVRCQKICKGPVVGVVVNDRMEWFQRVDGVKPVAALLRLTTEHSRRSRSRCASSGSRAAADARHADQDDAERPGCAK